MGRILVGITPFGLALGAVLLWEAANLSHPPRPLLPLSAQVQELLRAAAVLAAALGFTFAVASLARDPDRRVLVIGACVNAAVGAIALLIRP